VALAEAGLGRPVAASGEGYVAQPWIDGRAMRRPETTGPAFHVALTGYLCARAPLFHTGQPVDRTPLLRMLQVNASEVVGPDVPGLGAALERLERLPEREAVIPDARMRPCEWLSTSDGPVKIDALDHGRGARLPGPTDLAWDLAGAALALCGGGGR
jgi:hypothetical protein